MTTNLSLETPEATLAYDVRGPLPPADGRPPLFMVAAPMGAEGFTTLASHFSDRTVVTYDPRGLGRSIRHDGRTDHTPEQNAEDLHNIVVALGAGPVEMFASSGGAVSALALVAAHPGDVSTLVAHEPPLLTVLPDAERALAAEADVQSAYLAKGWGSGMARFIALIADRMCCQCDVDVMWPLGWSTKSSITVKPHVWCCASRSLRTARASSHSRLSIAQKLSSTGRPSRSRNESGSSVLSHSLAWISGGAFPSATAPFFNEGSPVGCSGSIGPS